MNSRFSIFFFDKINSYRWYALCPLNGLGNFNQSKFLRSIINSNPYDQVLPNEKKFVNLKVAILPNTTSVILLGILTEVDVILFKDTSKVVRGFFLLRFFKEFRIYSAIFPRVDLENIPEVP